MVRYLPLIPGPSAAAVRLRGVIAGLALVAVVVAIYRLGLHGGMVLDDDINLQPLIRYLQGEVTWEMVVFGNPSGMLGRPLSMLSFLFNATTTGYDLWPMKVTNLVLHLACGLLIIGLVTRLAGLDPRLRDRAHLLGWLLGAIWLVLPIQVSTVLYLIQRMTQWSTLLVLAALWLYVVCRSRYDERARSARIGLFVGFPLLTALAALSKENGAVAPLLAAIIESAYFASRVTPADRRFRRLFFGLFLIAPAILAAAWMVAAPDRWFGHYLLRDFGPLERVLTQARVLWEYVGMILVPVGPRLGLFHDDVQVSTGLLSPPTTLLAVVGWLAVGAYAVWAWRRGHAAPWCGLGLFLGGHVLESSVIPLELMFEHRNYLPSVGVLLFLAGAAVHAGSRLKRPSPGFRVLGAAGLLLLVAAYATTSWIRAGIWADSTALYRDALNHHPQSPRLRQTFALEAALEGNPLALHRHLQVLEAVQPREAGMRMLLRLLAHCDAGQPPPPGLVERVAEAASERLGNTQISLFRLLSERVIDGRCPGVDAAALVRIGRDWLAASRLPPTIPNMWMAHYWLARLHVAMGQGQEALAHARRAYADSSGSVNMGILVFQIEASLGRLDEAGATLEALEARDHGWDLVVARGLRDFRAYLEQHAPRSQAN